jgi:hypothetical protein
LSHLAEHALEFLRSSIRLSGASGFDEALRLHGVVWQRLGLAGHTEMITQDAFGCSLVPLGRARALRSPATDEIAMPDALLSVRQEHKRHVAKLFDRIAEKLARHQLTDMVAALDLIYEPTFCSIAGLTSVEALALRALGKGANGRFSVWLGSNLLSEAQLPVSRLRRIGSGRDVRFGCRHQLGALGQVVICVRVVR